MKRGVKRTNVSYKLLTGGLRSRDKEQRDEPIPQGDAKKPKFVSAIPLASEIWDEYMSIGLGTRVLTAWDSRLFGTYCVMCAEFESHVMGNLKTGFWTPPASWLAQYRMYGELFGVVPAGRTRIKERTPASGRPNGTQEKDREEKGSPENNSGFFD